jgi:methylmalonyl-CoA mutase cobalamin-binding domain/chain
MAAAARIGKMADNLDRPDRRRKGADSRQLDTLATRALTVVAAQSKSGIQTVQPDLFDALLAALRDFDPQARLDVVQKLYQSGIGPDAIVDLYIPEAARHLGAAWCEDQMSFADVTIGSARLQGMLRDVGDAMTVPHLLSGPSILVVVPYASYHTLGGSVLTQQLRRQGYSVVLAIGQTDDEVLQIVSDKDFDMILISASGAERLDLIAQMIKNIRNIADIAPPIVLGGTILEQETDVKALSGADFITMDPKEAIRLCGLTIPVLNDAQSVLGS